MSEQSEREMLEWAARAVGKDTSRWIDGDEPYSGGPGFVQTDNGLWNPLENSGQALELVVKLGLHVEQDWFRPQGGYDPSRGRARVFTSYVRELACSFDTQPRWHKVLFDGDPMVATRRAIVMAAAEIGRAAIGRAGGGS